MVMHEKTCVIPILISILNSNPLKIFLISLILNTTLCRLPYDFNTRNKLLTQKLLKQGYQYHKIRKTFSNFIDDTMI